MLTCHSPLPMARNRHQKRSGHQKSQPSLPRVIHHKLQQQNVPKLLVLPHETRADFLLNSKISHSSVVTVLFCFLLFSLFNKTLLMPATLYFGWRLQSWGQGRRRGKDCLSSSTTGDHRRPQQGRKSLRKWWQLSNSVKQEQCEQCYQ